MEVVKITIHALRVPPGGMEVQMCLHLENDQAMFILVLMKINDDFGKKSRSEEASLQVGSYFHAYGRQDNLPSFLIAT
jgi:hypothetical protein